MSFSNHQIKKLVSPLRPNRIQTREIDGRKLNYIEGWFAIAEANAIFGFDGWDRETVHFERAYERTRGVTVNCGYTARVRISVRTGAKTIKREGTGFGQASADNLGDAHDRALKSAETDATKRALATFGSRFGLSLYDKDLQAKRDCDADHYKDLAPRRDFTIIAPDGTHFAQTQTPQSFCSGIRQLVELAKTPQELDSLRRNNIANLQVLRSKAPKLVTRQGAHYADVLEKLINGRRSYLTERAREPANTPPQTNGGQASL